MKTQTPDSLNRIKLLTDLGFALRIVDGPKGVVTDDNWQCIRYLVELTYKGKEVITTDYSLGIGHVDIKAIDMHKLPLEASEQSMLHAWKTRPGVKFTDPVSQAKLAAKIAKYQKVTPQLDDVLYSLIRDGDAFFNAQTFEQWADEFGYDTDSRKAEQTYKACDRIGRKLAGSVPATVLSVVRDITQDM